MISFCLSSSFLSPVCIILCLTSLPSLSVVLVSQSPGMAPQQPASLEFLQRGVPSVCEVTSLSVQRGRARGSFISGCSRSRLRVSKITIKR